MTTPITAPVGSGLPPTAPLDAALAPALQAAAAAVLGPALIENPAATGRAGANAGFCSVDELSQEIMLLQTENAAVQSKNETQKARASHETQLASLQKRLEQAAKAAEEQAKAEKSGFWSKVFKWVAAVVAAVAGAVSSAVSGGAGAAVAAVVIAAIFTAESAVKAVTDALVECRALSPKAAGILRACLGMVEDIVTQLGEAGAFGEKGKTVADVLNLVLGAAKAIVACVVGDSSGVVNTIGNVCSLTAEATRAAQEVVCLVYEELGKQEKLPDKLLLAMAIFSLCLDATAMGCAFGDRGSAGDSAPSTGSAGIDRAKIADTVASVLETIGAGATIGQAAFGAAHDIDRANAAEAQALAEREEALIDAAVARITEARRHLDNLFTDLESVLDDAAAMQTAADDTFAAALTPSRA